MVLIGEPPRLGPWKHVQDIDYVQAPVRNN